MTRISAAHISEVDFWLQLQKIIAGIKGFAPFIPAFFFIYSAPLVFVGI